MAANVTHTSDDQNDDELFSTSLIQISMQMLKDLIHKLKVALYPLTSDDLTLTL